MRIFQLLILCILSTSFLFGQTCVNNPSVQTGDLNPAPLYPGAPAQASFTFFENLQDYSGFATDPITMTLCMLNVAPANGPSSVSGSASTWFNWLYDPGSNCLQGTQNQTIFGGTGGAIVVDLTITNPITCGASNQMGFNVNLQVAACMTGVNEQSDDTESVYTCYDPNGGTSSLEDLEQMSLDISLFPNPAAKQVTLSINSDLPSQNADILITDLLGRTLKTLKNKAINQGENSYRLNIKNLANGTYFVTVAGEDGSRASVKLIKAVD